MGQISKKIKVLIVDDSAVVRNILSKELSKDPNIEIVGTAIDPYVARDKIIHLRPDVISLDVEMPRMDGITFLERLMEYYPMPVVIFSSLTPKGCEMALKAMDLGAIDVMHKPQLSNTYKLQDAILQLRDKIRAAAETKYRFIGLNKDKTEEKPVKSYANMGSMIKTTDKIVAIGASTGGTVALRTILQVLPANFPGIIVTQHMPANFTKSFADSLNTQCAMEVREAKDGDTIYPGLVLISPGNFHTILRRSGARYYVQVKDGPLVFHQRPSVEVLFNSVSKYAGRNALGVILTGMGKDGAEGLLNMKKAGAFTIAQDEKSCVVYGMPKEAVNMGAVDKILPLNRIPDELMMQVKGE